MIRPSILTASFILLCGLSSSAHALIPNGDFEQGDLSGYFAQEDFVTVPSSALVNNAALPGGGQVGQIDTGFTDFGVTTATLARDFGTLPADVQDLFFEVRFLDMGEDNPPIIDLESSPEIFALEVLDADQLTVGIGSDANNIPSLFTLNSTGFTAIAGTEVESLPNGFYRVKTNIASLAGTPDSALYFDLRDGDDQRLSRVQVDNIDISVDESVVPEPATMLLMGGGLLGFGYLRKKKIV